MGDAYLRIAEFSARVGVSSALIRAWERRYALLTPERSPGGFRLYSDADAERVRRMVELMGTGVAAADAARRIVSGDQTTSEASRGAPDLETAREQLGRAIEAFSAEDGHRLLDDLFARFQVETILQHVIVPLLHDLGRRWQAGVITPGQEHFASHLLRTRLLAMARDWGTGFGPVAILAAPPGEAHDLPLVVFGVAAHRRGWRITFLGADTPVADLTACVRSFGTGAGAGVVVLAATRAARFTAVEEELAELAAEVPVAIAGAGASRARADKLGALHLSGDPVTAAAELLGRVRGRAAHGYDPRASSARP